MSRRRQGLAAALAHHLTRLTISRMVLALFFFCFFSPCEWKQNKTRWDASDRCFPSNPRPCRTGDNHRDEKELQDLWASAYDGWINVPGGDGFGSGSGSLFTWTTCPLACFLFSSPHFSSLSSLVDVVVVEAPRRYASRRPIATPPPGEVNEKTIFTRPAVNSAPGTTAATAAASAMSSSPPPFPPIITTSRLFALTGFNPKGRARRQRTHNA